MFPDIYETNYVFLEQQTVHNAKNKPGESSGH